MNTIETGQALYAWGQRVIALYDLENDGSYPERLAGDLLVARGTLGEVVNVGLATDTNEPVYLVEFEGALVLGCMEDEILPAPRGLLPLTDAPA